MHQAHTSYIPAVPCCSRTVSQLIISRRRLVSEIVQKPYQWLAWLSSAVLIASAVMASLDLYPYYVIGFMISNTLWTIVGLLWRERSLVLMNAALTGIYIIGMIVK
jgi:hypothetical protein